MSLVLLLILCSSSRAIASECVNKSSAANSHSVYEFTIDETSYRIAHNITTIATESSAMTVSNNHTDDFDIIGSDQYSLGEMEIYQIKYCLDPQTYELQML